MLHSHVCYKCRVTFQCGQDEDMVISELLCASCTDLEIAKAIIAYRFQQAKDLEETYLNLEQRYEDIYYQRNPGF